MAYFQSVAQDLAGQGPLHFAGINCHVNGRFCDQLGLMGHPMVGFVYGGCLVPFGAHC